MLITSIYAANASHASARKLASECWDPSILTLSDRSGNPPEQSTVVQIGTVQLRYEHDQIRAVADRPRSGGGQRRGREASLPPLLPWIRLLPISWLRLPSAQLPLRLF